MFAKTRTMSMNNISSMIFCLYCFEMQGYTAGSENILGYYLVSNRKFVFEGQRCNARHGV